MQGQDKEQATKSVYNFLRDPMTQKLIAILEKWDLELSKLSQSDYENESWAYKQADTNGARRTLQKIKDLLNVE